MAPGDDSSRMQWTLLDPEIFSKRYSSPGSMNQYAKDENYLNAVLNAWKEEFSANNSPVEISPLQYKDADDNPLYGRIVRSVETESSGNSKPGVLLFHTAAGPSDVFLLYKASLLAREGCIVLICDIFSDAIGWGWNIDRTQYNEEREKLAKDDHRLLQSRVETAILALVEEQSSWHVDRHRLAALGWCLGGQPILEIPQLQIDTTLRIMVTFHGVFHRATPLGTPSINTMLQDCHVLICNGEDDPFVCQQDLEEAKHYFEAAGCRVEIMALTGARHGFTNPAQAYNDHESFDYNLFAAEKSWERALLLLKRHLFSQ
jgi:dienelactone hydrolase